MTKSNKVTLNKVKFELSPNQLKNLETVNKVDNFHFYNLINEFHKLTNVPIILNTSFNENEPIVLNPDHAFDCFRRTSMDCLVLENWIISR